MHSMGPTLRSARAATFTYFVLCGTVMGTWLVHIPQIEERTGITHSTLGTLLVLLGLGAFVGMQVSGRLTDRIGMRIVIPVSAVITSATLVLPGLAHSALTLALALVVFGFCNGCLDASMNALAVHVEAGYARPIMSAFHAMFSIGGVLAAIIGAAMNRIIDDPVTSMAIVGAVGVVASLLAARRILVAPISHAPDAMAEPSATVGHGTGGSKVWVLAILALMVMLCEGAANDWSALHLKDILGASPSVAAFAFGTYSATMTIGRFTADRVAGRFGSMAVLRYGAAIAAVGAMIAAFTPWIWLAYLGWGLFGLGLSGCVPQLFSAAGRVDPASAGTNVSRVAGLGYLGMLAGPAIIGWLTHVVPLNHAFVLLGVLCLVAAVCSGVLRRGRP